MVWAFNGSHKEALAPVIALFLLTTMCFPAAIQLVGYSAHVESLLNCAGQPSNLILFNYVQWCFDLLHEWRNEAV